MSKSLRRQAQAHLSPYTLKPSDPIPRIGRPKWLLNVYPHVNRRFWFVRVTVDDEKHYGGLFTDLAEAMKRRDYLRRKLGLSPVERYSDVDSDNNS